MFSLKKLNTVFALGMCFTSICWTSSISANTSINDVVESVKGTSYQYGGSTPTTGFDCSGFTLYVFSKLGVKLPHSSSDQYTLGENVTLNDLERGDLVFFNTSGQGVSHVGIFIGEETFVHASTKKGVVFNCLTEEYWKNKYVGARKILKTIPPVIADVITTQ